MCGEPLIGFVKSSHSFILCQLREKPHWLWWFNSAYWTRRVACAEWKAFHGFDPHHHINNNTKYKTFENDYTHKHSAIFGWKIFFSFGKTDQTEKWWFLRITKRRMIRYKNRAHRFCCCWCAALCKATNISI